MRHALPAVVLVLCCLLAGCNAFAPGATPDSSEPPTVTPADVPRAGSDRIAPGLTAERVVDGAALLAAHESVLANRTVTLRDFSRATAPNGTELYDQRIERRYAADRSHLRIDGHGIESSYGSSVELWANESVGLYRYGGHDDPHYRQREVRFAMSPVDQLRFELRLDQEYSKDVETRSLGTENGYERFQVTFEGRDGVSFVVDERGFVSEVHHDRQTALTYSGGSVENATIEDVVRYEVGDGSLERPSWVSDARETIADREYVVPGVTTEGILDTRSLVESHREVVGNTSVSYRYERRVVTDGTLETVERRTRRISREPQRFSSVERQGTGRETDREAFWANETAGYVQQTRNGETTYYRNERPGTRRQVPEPSLSSQVEFSDGTVTALDGGRYRVAYEDYRLNYRYSYGTASRVLNSSLVVVVDERGYVASVDRTFTVEADDGTVSRTTVRARYGDLGETTVDRPDWFDAAVNATDGTVDVDDQSADGETTTDSDGTDGAGVDGTTTASATTEADR